jgi:nitroimidazol reductase NimA-like FMN-containing flavoprotein (pyridoxamine 5'-phosphate oxidase superfamily)
MFRELTRKKQALSHEKCIEILQNEPRGVLSVLGDGGYPYGMPMNFLYDNGKIYFHSGKKGHKVDAISRDERVSFCVFDGGYRKDGEWALNISSVIVFGRMRVVDDFDKTVDICRKLSLKFTDDLDYIEKEIASFAKATLCYELTPEHITGKLVNES